MKFSLIYEAQTADTSRAGDARVLNEIVEQAILAEEVGFDVIWAVEHTALEQYAHMSVPETVLAFIAGRTSRIHVGHGVICLPPNMNHPVKVAERCAALDILSNGRLQVGFGKGGTQQESGTFGYDLVKLPPAEPKPMPPVRGPVGPGLSIADSLRDPVSLRRAIVINEVLGPPVSVRAPIQ